jgi:hypothetical protein
MTTQPTVHPATRAATSIHQGMPTGPGLRAETRTAHAVAGFGGAAAGPHQAAGLALIAAAVMLALLFLVTVRRNRSGASR